MTNALDTITATQKETMTAWLDYHMALAKGLHDVHGQLLSLAQTTLDAHLTHGKAVLGLKTPQQWLTWQTNWACHCFETALSAATKLSDLSAKLTQQAVGPTPSSFRTTVNRITDNTARAA